MPDVVQLKISLLDTAPPIWRRVAVPTEFTLAQLHKVIQAAMGWENSHLYDFRIGAQVFGQPEPRGFAGFPGGPRVISDKKVLLADAFPRKGSKAVYTYDFGDSWEHAIVVEKISPADPGTTYPSCMDGALAGPPEDCGGIPGFYNLLDALADADHEEHEDLMDWTGGGFDSQSFSVEAVNQRLLKMFRPARKPAAKKPSVAKPALQRRTPNP